MMCAENSDAMDFDVLINAAAFTNVDACETERDRAFLINAEAPGVLAEICNAKDAKLIHFSTDYVFDGEKRAPYTEEDQANPISFYGESKLCGRKERACSWKWASRCARVLGVWA